MNIRSASQNARLMAAVRARYPQHAELSDEAALMAVFAEYLRSVVRAHEVDEAVKQAALSVNNISL